MTWIPGSGLQNPGGVPVASSRRSLYSPPRELGLVTLAQFIYGARAELSISSEPTECRVAAAGAGAGGRKVPEGAASSLTRGRKWKCRVASRRVFSFINFPRISRSSTLFCSFFTHPFLSYCPSQICWFWEFLNFGHRVRYVLEIFHRIFCQHFSLKYYTFSFIQRSFKNVHGPYTYEVSRTN